MRVLVLGAGGQVGERGRRGGARAAPSHRAERAPQLDIADAAAVERATARKPGRIGSSMPPPTRRWILPRIEPAQATRGQRYRGRHTGAGRGGRGEPAAASVDGFRVRRQSPTALICRAIRPIP